MKTNDIHPVLGLVALSLGLVACSSQPTPTPREATRPPPVVAHAAPPPGAVVTDTPITPEVRAAPKSPTASPSSHTIEPVVETQGPLSESQRVVLGAVATCMQSSLDKGNGLRDRNLTVNVTVEPSGAVSGVSVDGASAKLTSCAEPGIRKARYPSTDDSVGARVMQYPMNAKIQDANGKDE